MKQKYVKVNAEIIEFETEDIITDSIVTDSETLEDGGSDSDDGQITLS